MLGGFHCSKIMGFLTVGPFPNGFLVYNGGIFLVGGLFGCFCTI